jgi:hypothetical protein
MPVTRQYTLPFRAFVDSLAGTIRLRLTRKLADALNGIDLNGARVGDIFSLRQREGGDLPHAKETDTYGATVSASVGLPDDWDLIITCSLNILLVGPPQLTRTCVQALAAQFCTPIVTIRPGLPLMLPSVGEAGTLIVNDLAALSAEDQQRLLEWLNCPNRQTRVISTSPTALVTKMAEGKFVEALYYRLNTVYVSLAA